MKVTLERTLKRAIKVQWGVRRKTPSLSAWWNDEGKGGVQRGREESLGSQKIRVFYPNVGKDYKERKEDKIFLRSTREKRRSVSTLRWWNSVALHALSYSNEFRKVIFLNNVSRHNFHVAYNRARGTRVVPHVALPPGFYLNLPVVSLILFARAGRSLIPLAKLKF